MFPSSSRNLPCSSVFRIVIRCKAYRPKHVKPAPKKLQSATRLALDHFDFYYGPRFKTQWNSIRLALLCDQKYAALINNFHGDSDKFYEEIRDSGGIDLVAAMIENQLNNDQKPVEKEKREIIELDPIETFERMEEQDFVHEDFDEELLRSEAGMSEFVPARDYSALDDKENYSRSSEKYWSRSPGGQLSRVPDDRIQYPERLSLLSFPKGDTRSFGDMHTDVDGTMAAYFLDASSVLPVLALGLQSGDNVLDLCAAPGGKSLAIMQTLLPESLTCNDISLPRLNSIGNLRSKVVLKRLDAAHEEEWNVNEVYDKVLVDVPCSTDKHSLFEVDDNIFQRRNSKYRQRLPELQTRLLLSGIRSLKQGGSLIYSTCSLASNQNEAVVAKAVALASRYYRINVIEKDLDQIIDDTAPLDLFRFYTNCAHGVMVVPFLPSNFGPIYMCKLQRL